MKQIKNVVESEIDDKLQIINVDDQKYLYKLIKYKINKKNGNKIMKKNQDINKEFLNCYIINTKE